MRIVYAVVPADCLPRDLHASIIEGEDEVVLQVSDAATPRQICEALNSCINEYAAATWMHVGGLELLADAG